ncbi:MAG: DHHA1 domain-containing protein, partial [Actinomycetota bacterium]|nr:DHHA1 domain-containing protein [Actinomycetota bacterium]
FMYENTGTRAHVMAAELIEAGVDVQGTYRRLYEEMPYGKLALLGRALERVERHDEGSLTLTRLTREDYALAGAQESYSEGVVDHLRSVRGTKVAALARELSAVEGKATDARRTKVSLRSTDGAVDVSAIAREQGGGGHRQAAGFTTALAHDELVAFLRGAICAQLAPA